MGPSARLPALDGVRGIAIVLVMLCHYTESGRGALFEWTRGGWCGVDLFFVLSGFLVTGILLDARGTPHAMRNFYARRTLRIFPLYYGFLALTLVALPSIKPAGELGLDRAIEAQGWLWSYTTNLGQAWSGDWIYNTGRFRMHHFWSLAVEEHFYLAWPWVVLFASDRTIRRVCVVALLVSPVLRGAILLGDAVPLAAIVLTPCRLDALAAGALLATLIREAGGPQAARRFSGGALLAGSGALAVLWGWRGHPLNLADPVVVAFAPSGLGALFAGAVGLAATSPGTGLAYRLCAGAPLRALGKISYGLYIFHLPLLSVIGRWVGPGVLSDRFGSETAGVFAFSLMGMGLSVVVAAASWVLFERPLLTLKRFFEYRPEDGRDTQPRAAAGADERSPARASQVAWALALPASQPKESP